MIEIMSTYDTKQKVIAANMFILLTFWGVLVKLFTCALGGDPNRNPSLLCSSFTKASESVSEMLENAQTI